MSSPKPDSKPASSPKPAKPTALKVPTFDPGPSARLAATALAETKVAAVVIGRLAVWAWVTDPAEQAFTKDLDFGVARADVPKLRAWAAAKGLKVSALQIGGFNAADAGGAVSVDFIDRSAEEWGDLSGLFEAAVREAVKRQQFVNVGGRKLLVVPLAHLTVMKLAAGRTKDDDDLKRLLNLRGTDIDQVRQVAREFAPALLGRLESMLQNLGHPAAKKRYKLS